MLQAPDLTSVLSEVGSSAVVVPLLMGAGFHVHVDIANAVDEHRRRTGRYAAAAETLGPDPALTSILRVSVFLSLLCSNP